MKNQSKIFKFEIFSIIFTFVLGTLLHFTFEWSNSNSLVGAFSTINESTWEHLKLLFYPMLLSTIIGYFYLSKDVTNFLCSRIFGALSSMLFTLTSFYTYSGILGSNISILNIAIFYIAVLIGEYVSYKLMLSSFNCNNKVALILFSVFLFFFVFFTYFPPRIGLFKDPANGRYGIVKTI